jgi:DNA polymerase (family 10)
VRNAEIADAFEELASLYELDGAVVYRVLAYRNAAKAIREAGVSVAELSRQGRAEELAGVGKTIAEKITALLDTGSIPSAEKLRKRNPPGLIEVTRMPGLGPKRARVLNQELGIESIDDLRQAAEAGRIRGVRGFGPKAEESILAGLAAGEDGRYKPRLLLSKALEIGEALAERLREHPTALRVELAGSARRWADSVKDLDVVASTSDPKAFAEAFAALPQVAEVHSSGEAGARGVTHQGLPVDLRVVAEENFGNLLQHFTGSGKHNEALRAEAVRRGLHVSEYGVGDDESGQTHACATEEEVYRLLGMDYIEPELRENRGELAAAREGRLPKLIQLEDIRGELHCHTRSSDGRNTAAEMAAGAQTRGYEYMAITDHSATHGFGNDVQPDQLEAQIELIHELNQGIVGFTLLAGSEVNVDTDGSLDYDDELLEQLDWIVASLHSSFRMGEKEQTERMIAAMEHPLVDAIGHPTGRLIGRREPYPLDIERVIEAAIRTGTFLEINANPNRRDLNDSYARLAGESGAMLVIDADAHGVDTLANTRYGVATARRGWLTAEQVANTRPWPELDKLRKRSRA